MKTAVPVTAGAFLAAVFATAAVTASEPLRVEFEKANGETVPAYLVEADEANIMWKYTPETQSVNRTARTDIKGIDFDDPEEWGEAMGHFNMSSFEKSAELFGAIAEKYKGIMILEGNPASKAKYFQIESIRRLGQFDKIGAQLTPATLATLTKSLDPQFGFQLALNNAWAAAAAGNWGVVNQIVAEQALPREEGQTRQPEFKKELPPSEMVQLTYMRALSSEAAGDKAAALGDYYRTFTLGYGGDRNLSAKAMLNALAILEADEKLAEDRTKLREIHALAMIYKDSYGGGAIADRFSKYAVPLPPAEGEEEAPPPAREAAEKAAPETPPAPAADAAPAPAESGAKAKDEKK